MITSSSCGAVTRFWEDESKSKKVLKDSSIYECGKTLNGLAAYLSNGRVVGPEGLSKWGD